MKKILTIDAGTSNLRIRILEGEKILFERRENYGVKIGKEKFKKELYDVLKETIKENQIENDEIACIIASGMITSALGLMEIEHLHVPVSLKKLSEHIIKYNFFEFEIFLITGIKVEKKYFEDSNLKSIDVIRGEEVEVFGILDEVKAEEPLLIILPGSHNKFIEVDEGNIVNLLTTMSGEIYDVMTKHTILKISVNEKFADRIEKKYLELGNKIGRNYGINQGSFMLRGLDFVEKLTVNEKSNYLLGLILSEDIFSLENNGFLKKYNRIIIAGRNIIAKGLFTLLSDMKLNSQVEILESSNLATKGALKIWKEKMGEGYDK